MFRLSFRETAGSLEPQRVVYLLYLEQAHTLRALGIIWLMQRESQGTSEIRENHTVTSVTGKHRLGILYPGAGDASCLRTGDPEGITVRTHSRPYHIEVA